MAHNCFVQSSPVQAIGHALAMSRLRFKGEIIDAVAAVLASVESRNINNDSFWKIDKPIFFDRWNNEKIGTGIWNEFRKKKKTSQKVKMPYKSK